MLLDAPTAAGLFVGLVVAVLAGLPVIAGRRTPEGVTLAVFLALVAWNFLAGAALFLVPDPGRADTLLRSATLVLAWDPLLFLAFATLFPYRRRTPGVHGLLGVIAAGAIVATFLLAFRPEVFPKQGAAPGWVILIGNLLVAYVATWILSLRAVRLAPTPALARRAAWLAAAVGVVVVPRVGLVFVDLSVHTHVYEALDMASHFAPWIASRLPTAVGIVLAIPLMVAAFWAGVREARGPAATHGARDHLGTTLRAVGIITAALVVANVTIWAWVDVNSGVGVTSSTLYGLRWIIFGVILVHGILAYDVVEFERASRRFFALVGGLIGGVGAFLLTTVVVSGTGESDVVALGLATAVGLGALMPAAALSRALLPTFAPFVEGGASSTTRRLELYRAALEAAYARGTPSPEARRRLERDRRAFGCSSEEAVALEHVVASALGGGGGALQVGDEAAPGIVLDSVLGEGAQGRVFLATRQPSGERVVVKQMRADAVGDERTRRRFLAEVQALRRLDHPGIARLLEVHAVPGRHLLVLEHVDGESLAARLARGPASPEDVRAWAGDLLDALGAAHAAGVVHGDVKPSNVLVGKDGRARLTDFGLARAEGDSAISLQATASEHAAIPSVAGTVAYMSPEQARGEPARAASDLYALGLVVVEAFTGKPAIDLRGYGLYPALARVAEATVDVAAAPSAWHPFLRVALHGDPARRFPSAHAMRAAIPPSILRHQDASVALPPRE